MERQRVFILNIFILTSLLAVANLNGRPKVAEAGSKSSKGSSKTTVIAIDGGGGGGGRPHPVPVPWPVVHCHHHHHHLKYVPKPVLVHHWVKKAKAPMEDFAAGSVQLEQQQQPMQLMEQQEPLQLEPNQLPVVESAMAHMQHQEQPSNSIELSHQAAALELEQQQQQQQRPYALAMARQEPHSSAASMANLDDFTSFQMGATNATAPQVPAPKPSHPFKGVGADQLKDESRADVAASQQQQQQQQLHAKLERLNARERQEARRTFDRFARDHAIAMAAIGASNQRLLQQLPSMNAGGRQVVAPPPPTPASRTLQQVSARASLSESRAIELVTKLAEQMAQAEARKMLLRAAATAAAAQAGKKPGQQTSSGRRTFALFGGGGSSSGQTRPAHKRRSSSNFTPASLLALQQLAVPTMNRRPSFAVAPPRPARHLASAPSAPPSQDSAPYDQMASEASNDNKVAVEPTTPVAAPSDGPTTAAPPASTSARPPPSATTTTATTTTTLSPELESNFYLGQRQHLYGTGGINELPYLPHPMLEFALAPPAQSLFGSRRLPRHQPSTVANGAYKWEASDVHKLIAEAPQQQQQPPQYMPMSMSMAMPSLAMQFPMAMPMPMSMMSSMMGHHLANSSEDSSAFESSSNSSSGELGESQAPQQYLRDLDPFSAHSFASLVTRTPQEVALEQQRQQLMPHLASPYLEFPLSPEKWSTEAVRSLNGAASQPASSLNGDQSLETLNTAAETSGWPEQQQQQGSSNHLFPSDQGSFSYLPYGPSPSGAPSDSADLSSSPSVRVRAPRGPIDPLVGSAAADLAGMRQLQANLNGGAQQQLINQLNSNFTAMTRLSRQLRDQMRSLQGRLPQMPQIPQLPQPPQMPNLPMPPPGMMQMAGMALPFALARATRSSRDRQTQQVNAAAQAGGSTAGGGVRQRVLNRALSLTNRIARPRPRRPPNQPQSSSSTQTGGSNGSRNPRGQRLFGAVRTVIDLSRRPSGAARPPLGVGGSVRPAPQMKPKIDDFSSTGGGSRLVGRVFGQLGNSLAQRVTRTELDKLPSQVLATMADGSLAALSSMTSPLELLEQQMGDDWPRINRQQPQSQQQSHQQQPEITKQQQFGVQQPEQVEQQQLQDNQLQQKQEFTRPIAIPLHPTPHQQHRMRAHISGARKHHQHGALVANHINLLLITAQNVTQGHQPASSPPQATQPPPAALVTEEVTSASSAAAADENSPAPGQSQRGAEEEEQQQQQQQAAAGGRDEATGQPSMLAPVKVKRPSLQQAATSPRPNTRPPLFSATTPTTTTTTKMTTTSSKTAAANSLADADNYLRAIRLVRGSAYPWPPPTKSSLVATKTTTSRHL